MKIKSRETGEEYEVASEFYEDLKAILHECEYDEGKGVYSCDQQCMDDVLVFCRVQRLISKHGIDAVSHAVESAKDIYIKITNFVGHELGSHADTLNAVLDRFEELRGEDGI